MEQFNLEDYLENPTREVVTGFGDYVRIVCTDKIDDNGYCIVGLVLTAYGDEVVQEYNANGVSKSYDTEDNNLFFGTKKKSGWCFLIKYTDGSMRLSRIFKTEAEAETQTDKYYSDPDIAGFLGPVYNPWEE